MSENEVSVEPSPETVTVVITQVKIQVNYVNLNESASINAILFTGDNVFYKVIPLMLTQPEYALWLEDSWLIDWVLGKLGLTKAPPAPQNEVISE
jgi:hypothetical protein